MKPGGNGNSIKIHVRDYEIEVKGWIAVLAGAVVTSLIVLAYILHPTCP